MKIRPEGSELFSAYRQTDRQTDERTDMTKLIFVFRNFANATEDCTYYLRMFKDDERGGARKCIQNFWYGNPKGKQFGRPRLIWRITLNWIFNKKGLELVD